MATSGNNQTFNVTIGANMDPSGVLGAVKQMQGAFNGLKLPTGITANMIKDFEKLQESLKKFESIAKQDHFSKTDIKSLQKLGKEIDSTFDTLKDSFNDLSGQKFYLEADYTKIKEARAEVDNVKADIQSKLNSIKIDFSSVKGGTTSLGLNELVSGMEKGVKSSKVLSAAMAQVKESLKAGDFSGATEQLTKMVLESNKLKGAGTGLLNFFSQLGLIELSKPANELVKTTEGTRLLTQALGKIVPELSKDSAALQEFAEKLKTAIENKEQLERTGAENFSNDIADGAAKVEDLGNAFKATGESTIGMAEATSKAAQEVQQLQQSTQYFFSLRNMLNLLKRGISQAVDSVRDLDKAMTETAVVTDFSVGDMWQDLPKYTQAANELGATTQGAYETMTLYYQQGLNQQQAFALGTETMKMARIAGLDYAETTDMMTAALRGFNMELDENSAKRVNDVYSELAARTASDTEELGTAMQRTASIAHSAGMSFEGTTAFLAQAIETTREPAENIGTAMKTIVARFQEMKKNPLEIVDVEGEEVSFNKVDTALQTIGVSLKDTNGQFRDLDQVFLDISQRWDSLSQTQQRYIATVAAGSRQQSRFIAMMSNYGRTVELMNYANNSAGASQEQFNKTMDSFEAKVNQLKNAWQRFTMGIANEKFVKGAIDGLTGLLTTVNNIIEKLSGGNGLVKSLLSVSTAFMGLKAGGRIINQLIGGLGGLVDPTSSFFGGFKSGAIKQGKDGTIQAKAISDPIVQAVNRIYSTLTGRQATQGIQNNTADFKTFQKASNELRGLTKLQSSNSLVKIEEKGLNLSRAYNTISNLDTKQQKAIVQQLPGLTLSLGRGITFDSKSLKGLSESAQKVADEFGANISKGVKDKVVSGQQALQIFGDRDTLRTALNNAGYKQDVIDEITKTGRDVYNEAYTKLQQENPEVNKDLLSRLATKKTGYTDKDDQMIGNYTSQITKADDLANSIGKVGTIFTSSGQAISQFGTQLSNLGFTQAGAAITNLGYKVASLGQMFAGLGTTITSVKSLFAEGGLLAGVGAGPIAAAVAAIAALGAGLYLVHKHNQNIRDSAKEVTESFEETNKQTQDNISALKQYQSQAATWAKGVDANGNNVSLSDEDYNAYLEAINKVAELNPEIVQGYNAQGRAIVDINSALKETIALQERNNKKALDAYTDEKALQKLLNARNIDKNYSAVTTTEVKNTSGTWIGQGEGYGTTRVKAAPMTDAVKNTIKQLQQQDWFDAAQFKEQFGIDVDNLTDDMVNKFVNSQDTINAAMSNWASAADGEFSEALTKSFDTLSEQTSLFDEAIQPAYQALQTYATNLPGFENIAPEFRSSIMAGLKDIVIQPDLDASHMQVEARSLVQEFDNLTSEGSAYATAMNQVEQAQNDFAQSLDAAEYAKGTEDALATLNNLMEQYAGKTDTYSQAIAEYLQNQIDRIKNFTEEGAISLSEALNTATNEIAAAEGAYDSFKEATKSDFSTGAESMRSIFDEITKETDGIALHMEGKGDKAFWTGAESLFGTDTLVNKTPEQVKKMFDRIEPMLQEGRAGFDAFWKDVFSSENVEKLKGIEGVDIDPENWMLNWDDNVNPDVFHEMAQALGMSDEFLTSMLNKGRQFGAIDFMDTDDVRKALSTDTAVVKGTSTTTVQGQNGPEQVVDMFVKGDYIRSVLADAGMVTPQDQQEAIDRLATQGIHIIKDPEQISSDDLKGMGISDMKSLIQTLGDTGQYTKDEIEAYAEKLGDYTPEDFADGYQKYLDAQEHPEIEPIQSIQSTVQQIASILASRRIEEGHLDNTDTSKAFQRSVYGEANVRDTKAQAFAVGRNEQGNVMTAEQYRINLADLQNAAIEAQKYIDALSSGMENASGQDLENMKAEKASMEATLSYLQDQINQGQQVWAEKYAQQQYDLAYQNAIDAGENVKTAQEEANTVKQDALKQAQELIQATQEGLTDGLNTTDTSGIKNTATESAKKYTDAGTGSTANITSSTITKGVEFVTKGVEEATKNIDTVDSKADEGATHTTEFKTSGEKEAEGAIKKMTDAGTGSKTVKVGASVDTSGAQKAASAIGGMSAKIGVGIKDNATAAAEKVRKGIDGKSASIDIKPNYTGSWTKTVTVREQKAATGVNNKIEAHHVPVFGSLAKGTKKGKLGPRNQGGITLTGEEGYEIAWLPSEGRSMILGANGPQMIDLPSDATVYNHEQSVDILRKRQTIDAGSLSSGNAGYVPPSSSGGSKKSKKKKNKKSKKSKKSKKKDTTPTINNWSIEEAVRYNIDQSLASITEEISLRTKDIEKNLEKIGTTYNDIVGTTQAQIAALEQVKQKNQELLASNQRQLADYRSRQQYVSWTDGNGESQNTLINIASYLNADGSVNTGAIAGLGNRALQEAVYKEISSAKGIVDGIRNAQKAIADADQQMADLGKKISEAFYQWENELTEVYDLTQRINNEVSFTNRFTSQIELELSKLSAGFGDTAQSIENARNVLLRNNKTIKDQIANQQQMIAARQRELNAALEYQDEVDKYKKFEAKTDWDSEATKTATLEWAKNLEQGATLGYKYVTGLFKDIDGSIQYEVDWAQFNADNEANPYTKDTYEAIKKYLDDLNSAATEFNNSIKDQTDFIKETYDALKEYQDYIADMEDTLIKGVEEQIEEAKDNAKQLSDSITSALKDLLDEVKRRLDERRKQEDNAKTERDISQKQQRLAMLRADTAGGNQVEIAQLEKEIVDSQQSYQRTLEDQLLDRLQQQADKAAEQRERQIELMQTGNQIGAATNKELVDLWLKDPERYKEDIKAAWLEAQGYDEKGEAGQYVLENQFESDFAQLVTAVEESNFKDSFNALTADTNSLAALLNELTNGELGRQDELSHGLGALTDATDRNTTSILTEMQKQNSAAFMKAKGVGADTLKTLGYTAKDLIGDDLSQPIYDLAELQKAGYKASELREAGVNDVGRFKSAGYSATDLKGADFTFADLISHYAPEDLKNADYGIADFANNNIDYNTAKALFGVNALASSGTSYSDQANKEIEAARLAAEEAERQRQAAAAAEAARQARVNAYNAVISAAHSKKTVSKGTLVDAINKGAAAGVSVSQVGRDLASGDGGGGVTWEEVVKAAKKAGYSKATVTAWWNGYGGYASKAIKKWSKFASGGLADYTGPAWLDGTPSKPELVLNATDTKNFLALRDVLSSAMKSTNAVTNSYGGDVMYDINIHVDKIEKDYDVDRVVDKVKKEITKGAGYRNVTQVRNFK